MKRRVYYVLSEPGEDERLPGVRLSYGLSINVSEKLAAELLEDIAFANLLGSPVEPVSIQESDIQWYEPEPGVELLVLDGLGPSRAEALVAMDIQVLTDMANLDDEQIATAAMFIRGVSEEIVRAWVEQAKSF